MLPPVKLRLRSSRPDALAELNDRERALWALFPADMRAFYERHNGGFPREELVFDVPMTRTVQGKTHQGQTTDLRALWAFMPLRVKPSEERPPSILREHFRRHIGERFLPRNVFVFGDNQAASLLAVSLNEHDHGEIYYWEWYWRYPWFAPFFMARVAEAKKRFAKGRRDLTGRVLPAEHDEGDALNYATLVSVGESFGEWRKGLRRDGEE
jgi:hypothetical protein